MRAHRARRATLVAFVALAASGMSVPARADTVTEWNQNASSALHGIAGQGAVSIAHMAMVHAAVYDAVNSIDRRHEPYLVTVRARPWYSQDAAAATAAYRVLVESQRPLVTPTQLPAVVALLEPLYTASLARIPDGPAKDGGIATGNAAAGALLGARMNDGRFGPFRFTVGTTINTWRPEPVGSVNDPGAWLKDVSPFLVKDSSQFRGEPPNPVTSRRYAREFNEVKELGALNSATRTVDQTAAARFWGATNGTATVSGILRTVAEQQGGSVAENARLFAMAYTTAADGLITTWADKARYSFWRPLTAIHQADDDGNPRTDGDEKWAPLLAAPPYPEHPSGLSALGGAAVRSLQDFYGTDKVPFRFTNAIGIERTYTRFSQVIREIVDARVWTGIHFRIADDEGAEIGEEVARWANRRNFRPVRWHHQH